MSACESTIDVSVIVPVYKVEQCLRRCLESICRQTHENIEILCVNDASPDGSQAILDEFAARDPRIVLLRHEENRGLGAARNTGIAAARGRYLAFVDSDDSIEPAMYATMLRRAREDRVRMVVCGMRLLWPGEKAQAVLGIDGRVAGGQAVLRRIEDVVWRPSKDGRVSLPVAAPGTLPIPVAISAWSKLYHRSLFLDTGLRYPEGIYMEDWGASLRALAACDEIAFISTPFYNYWQSADSISRGMWNAHRVYSFLKVIQDLDGFFHEIGLDTPTRDKIVGWHVAWGGLAMLNLADSAETQETFLAQCNPALMAEIARTPDFLRKILAELHEARHLGVFTRWKRWIGKRLYHSPFRTQARRAYCAWKDLGETRKRRRDRRAETPSDITVPDCHFHKKASDVRDHGRRPI